MHTIARRFGSALNTGCRIGIHASVANTVNLSFGFHSFTGNHHLHRDTGAGA
ncbi:hypothetical protein AAU01_29630 [Paenarthrobacter aurescens]|uniref:Uncharacterized protein n=1 Tax=Paenarthrobacter aurescens TaxID=43663 RepID=A0A4Y3NMB0_PAEAU|nr:hypothetical protein AAU01_29630 [Paenarthrobacter aurescens]